MSAAADFRSFLAADAAITALVGTAPTTRIYPLSLPQRPTLPALTYSWISATRIPVMDAPIGMASPRVQVDCWADTYLVAVELFEAVRQRLDGFKGTMGSPGTLVHGAFLDSERDFYEATVEAGTGSGRGIYRRSADYLIHYEELVLP